MAGNQEDTVLPSLRHSTSAGQDGTTGVATASALGTASTASPRAIASARAQAAAAAAAAAAAGGDEGTAAEGPRDAPAPPPRDRGALPRHPQLQRMRGGPPPQEDGLVSWAVRLFTAVSLANVLAIGALLFWRAVSQPPPCVASLQPLRGSQQTRGGHSMQGEGEQALPPKPRLHLTPAFLRQMERVTQRKLFRRNVTAGRRLHAINDAIIPIVPCPQKVRVHGPNGQPSFWLCMPQHLFGLHWPVAYSLTNEANYSYEVELHERYGVRSTVFDRTLPQGRGMSSQFPFVATVGGGEAESLLLKILRQSSVREEADPAAQLYSAASVLRSTCYACEYYFLAPAFGASRLAMQTAPPAVGQIVVHLDRWNAPWDASTRRFLQVMENAGYYAFHTEQIFGSYRNKSYSVSLIHQAILFPHLLGKENEWLIPQRQNVSR